MTMFEESVDVRVGSGLSVHAQFPCLSSGRKSRCAGEVGNVQTTPPEPNKLHVAVIIIT